MEDWFKQFDSVMDQFFKQVISDPYTFRYVITTEDGYPTFKEIGSNRQVKNSSDFDEIVTEDKIKFVFEMAGLEKENIQIDIEGDLLKVHGEHGERKYHHIATLKYPVEKNPKASYKNGILEVIFNRKKTTSTKVKVE